MDNLYQQLLQEIIMTLDIKDQYYMEFFFVLCQTQDISCQFYTLAIKGTIF